MKVSLGKSEIKGRVTAPPSKSDTIRVLMCAALAQGESLLSNPLVADDTGAARRVLEGIGVRISRRDDIWRVGGGNFREPEADLDCGDSAATLRFMTAIGALVPGKCRLVAGPSLMKRPVRPLIKALQQLGVTCSSPGETPPVIVAGGGLEGGAAELPGDVSSQFISALLLIAPRAKETVTIRLTTPLESRPYVLMTLECMDKFGVEVKQSADMREFEVPPQDYRPADCRIEGDWSSASYLLALGALAGEVTVAGLNRLSRQGDRVMLDFLRAMGAEVMLSGDFLTVRKGKLNALEANLADCVDLLPTLAALAAVAEGTSKFTGIRRARLKESNRVSALREGMERLGIEVVAEADRLVITGGRLKGAVLDARNDHRIAMAFGILGIVAGGVIINNAQCVAKTYPDFWNTLKSLGGEVKADG